MIQITTPTHAPPHFVCTVNGSTGNDVIVFPPFHWVLQRAHWHQCDFGFTPKSGHGVLHVWHNLDRMEWRGEGAESEGSTADTARKRPERPWTAARTMEGRVTKTMSVALRCCRGTTWTERKKFNFRRPAPPPCSWSPSSGLTWGSSSTSLLLISPGTLSVLWQTPSGSIPFNYICGPVGSFSLQKLRPVQVLRDSVSDNVLRLCSLVQF